MKYFKERAFKGGIEASFSKYRYSNDSLFIGKVFLRAGAFGIYYLAHSLLAIMPYRNSIKHKVTASYYKARCLYELRLIVDKDLQGFLRKQIWIE